MMLVIGRVLDVLADVERQGALSSVAGGHLTLDPDKAVRDFRRRQVFRLRAPCRAFDYKSLVSRR